MNGDPPVLELGGVGYRRSGRTILEGVDLTVRPGESWVVLGPNGCGKTTLARIATLWEHPTEGSVRVLGEELGRTDVRRLRERVALVSAAMADMIRPALTARDVVVSARHAALEPWWHTYTAADHERARSLLDAQGVGELADMAFGRLSSGERQRVMLARSLMADAGLVVLDEPAAGLDLAGREELVDRLDAVATDPGGPPMMLVTHHVEEIPPSFTHLVALRAGRVVAAGPVAETLDEELLAACFGIRVELLAHASRAGTRWSIRRA